MELVTVYAATTEIRSGPALDQRDFIHVRNFQTPVSTALHSPWKKVRRGIVSAILWVLRMTRHRVRPLLCRQSPPMIPLENIQVQGSEPWLTPKDLATICRTNANDARCMSWILRNITDPEALDAAIRLAGTIRWFEDGTKQESSMSQLTLGTRGGVPGWDIASILQGNG